MVIWLLLSQMGRMIAGIYAAAALLPAIYLLWYIYRHDTVEKEPMPLLLSLLLRGVAAALIASILEEAGISLLNRLTAGQELDQRLFAALFAFLVVAVSEEGCKYLLMKNRTWHDPNFNYRFDGIVYAVFTSLGFAAYENVLYVVRGGLSVALIRAVTAIPGHMAFAVVMGVFYGRAKWMEGSGNPAMSRVSRWLGLFMAIVLHGFYDTCAMIGTELSTLVFCVFTAMLFFRIFRMVRKESKKDVPIPETP